MTNITMPLQHAELEASAGAAAVASWRKDVKLNLHGVQLQVFTITTLPQQSELDAADQLVRRLSPGARRTYALGGTQKYELPTSEVSLSQVNELPRRHSPLRTIPAIPHPCLIDC